MNNLAQEKQNWLTEFDQKEGIMIHIFNSQIKMITNLKTQTISIWKSEQKAQCYNLSDFNRIEEYENLQIRTAKEAAILNKFSG